MAEETAERGENAYDWQSLMFLYNAAIKEVRTKLDIMNDEFQYIHQYNPIEYIKSRIKTPNSIAKKLSRHGLENTMENMVEHINDIAGVRIVCSFTSDIYRLADMIGRQSDITVLSIKDYIKNPKPSGYKSYHMIVTIPIFLSDRMVAVSYTHLTLPTKRIVEISVVGVSLQKKKKQDQGTDCHIQTQKLARQITESKTDAG